MTKTTHAKGPWNLMYPDNPFDGFVAGPDDKLVAIGMGEDTRANAKLIAAAPDMLSLLDEAASRIGDLVREIGKQAIVIEDLAALSDDIRDVIAKARGETP